MIQGDDRLLQLEVAQVRTEGGTLRQDRMELVPKLPPVGRSALISKPVVVHNFCVDSIGLYLTLYCIHITHCCLVILAAVLFEARLSG
jgi:hypothetical protein